MAATPKKRNYSNVIEWTADMWFKEFFLDCKLPRETLENYAFSFADNGITWDMLPLLTDDHLKQMKIVKVGHTIEIMRHIKEVMKKVDQEGSSAPKRLLSTVSKPASSPSSSGSNVIQLSSAERRPRHLLHQTPQEPSNKPRVLPPDEGSTLTVKMPLTVKSSNGERSSAKERISNQSVEVSSSTEKDYIAIKASQAPTGTQKSVFNRLGNVISSVAKSSQSERLTGRDESETSSQYSDTSILGKWTKGDTSGQRVSDQGERLHGENFFGPREPPQTFPCLDLIRQNSSKELRLPPPILKKTSPNRIQIPSLDNPLVTRVLHQTNQSSIPKTKRNISTTKQFIGSMKADREQFYREDYNNKNTLIKQRLGGKSLFGGKEDERRKEGKRVSFDPKVSQQEIPAIQGTQKVVNQTLSAYSGSLVLGTFRRNHS